MYADNKMNVVKSSADKHAAGSAMFFQPKLTINQPNDMYEQEADAMADQVMRMPEQEAKSNRFFKPAITSLQRKCAHCEEEEKNIQRKEKNPETSAGASIDPYINSLQGQGKSLTIAERNFFEPKFGYDFSDVRLHTDLLAARSAQSVNALAYTTGNNIVFNEGQYAPGTDSSKRLLGHELTHVVQQSKHRNAIQRTSLDNCSGRESVVNAAHSRAVDMLNNAISKLGTYNGTSPTDVSTALQTHFHDTSSGIAGWIQLNLNYLSLFTGSPQYECQDADEADGRAGWSMWCVPFTDIRLYPVWFRQSPDARARIMIHEWVHHYGCNFDLGYRNSPGYSGHGTARSLFNADPWAWLIYDIR